LFFAIGTVQSMTQPFMAIYFAKHFGGTTTGLLLTLALVASLFTGILGGYYADRIGRKKVMVASEAVFFLSFLLMAIANSPWFTSPVLTYITFFVNTVCWGIYGPADEAMLLDVTTVDNRQLMYSIFYWVNNLTMAVGTSIGSVLFETYRFALFSAMTVVVLLSLSATIFIITDSYRPSPRREGDVGIMGIIRNYTAVLKDTTFIKYVLAGVLVMSVEFQLSNYIGIHLEQTMTARSFFTIQGWTFHIDGIKMLGILQTENTLLVVFLALLANKLASRMPDQKTLVIGLTMNVIGYSFMTDNNSPLLLLAAMFMATLGEVLSVPARQAYLGDLAREHARSSYVAVNGMTFGLSRILASLGVILGTVLPGWGMALTSCVVGIVGLILYRAIVPAILERRLKNESAEAVG